MREKKEMIKEGCGRLPGGRNGVVKRSDYDDGLYCHWR